MRCHFSSDSALSLCERQRTVTAWREQDKAEDPRPISWDKGSTGVLSPPRVAGVKRLPLGGRAIVLNSRPGGTERFLGRRRSRRQSVVAEARDGGPRRAVWHRLGCDSPLSLR